jgi:hypothetical protein
LAAAASRPVLSTMRATDRSVIGVSTNPGQIALMVTSLVAISIAIALTKPTTACLLAQ